MVGVTHTKNKPTHLQNLFCHCQGSVFCGSLQSAVHPPFSTAGVPVPLLCLSIRTVQTALKTHGRFHSIGFLRVSSRFAFICQGDLQFW